MENLVMAAVLWCAYVIDSNRDMEPECPTRIVQCVKTSQRIQDTKAEMLCYTREVKR